MFSNRLPPHADVNALSRALESMRAAGVAIVDLTESNPTRAGLPYPSDLLSSLGLAAGLRYEPQPLGVWSARVAVAREFSRRGVPVDPASIVLSASTSEAYSWVFRLLCDPGTSVLVPQPSYPLFEHLTRMEAVRAVPYALRYHGRWEIDLDSIAAAPADTRAILLVSPNNPTGSYVTPSEADALVGIARDRGWAVVADEVFAEYSLDTPHAPTEIVRNSPVLSFTLGGASKSLGLPQVKIAWMLVGGPSQTRERALAGLEFIADTFLSVGTPVQLALPDLFARAGVVRDAIRDRIGRNLFRAREIVRRHAACTLLPVEGGWSAVVRVPALRAEDALVMELLQQEHVLVHPGYFFDFPHEAFLVLSLLPPESLFADAFERVLRVCCSS
jgi:aspartate/methionine/tyrosine aminotransferase